MVTDAGGNPLPNVPVAFTIQPGNSGASGAWKPTDALTVRTTTGSGNNGTVLGQATAPTLTANGTTGTFSVNVTVPGSPAAFTIKMQNKGKVSVPNVLGMTQANATDAINGELLNVTLNPLPNLKIPVGNVFGQNPIVNTQVNVGTAVVIDVSLGPP
jgi:hypothetical protein